MAFLLTLLVVAGLAGVVIVGLMSGTRLVLDKNRRRAVESDKQIAIAERTLRSIANNTSGRPELDAQIALDDISARKELS